MTESSIRPIVEAFYRASAERDVERVMAFIADDVNWLVQGPVDLFAFFGQRHGRAAVLEGYREIDRRLDVTAYQVETLLVDGDRAAALIRLTSVVRASDKVMSVRTSQFSRFATARSSRCVPSSTAMTWSSRRSGGCSTSRRSSPRNCAADND